jgi:hypothetical protein
LAVGCASGASLVLALVLACAVCLAVPGDAPRGTQYDPPFTIAPLRRNEVCVPVRRVPAAGATPVAGAPRGT